MRWGAIPVPDDLTSSRPGACHSQHTAARTFNVCYFCMRGRQRGAKNVAVAESAQRWRAYKFNRWPVATHKADLTPSAVQHEVQYLCTFVFLCTFGLCHFAPSPRFHFSHGRLMPANAGTKHARFRSSSGGSPISTGIWSSFTQSSVFPIFSTFFSSLHYFPHANFSPYPPPFCPSAPLPLSSTLLVALRLAGRWEVSLQFWPVSVEKDPCFGAD